jgi:hypothetical protein
LPGWSARPGQTPERIRQAIRTVDKLADALPSRTESIKADYLAAHQAITGDLEDLARWLGWEPPYDYRQFVRTTIQFWLPWERERLIRALRRSAAEEFKTCLRVEAALARGEPIVLPPDPWQEGRRRWIGDAPLLRQYRAGARWEAMSLMQVETARRAVRLQLALKAWQLEHGEVPGELQALVGQDLEAVPIDPYTGEPFQYFPQGVPVPLARRSGYYSELEPVLVADQPFVWSAGPKVVLARTDRDDPSERYEVQPWMGGNRPPHRTHTEYEVWAWGLIFPVPPSE